jgi:hypothetical protein
MWRIALFDRGYCLAEDARVRAALRGPEAEAAHAGRSDDEAIRTAKENLRNAPPPNAYGFSLTRQDGTEVFRWFNIEAE